MTRIKLPPLRYKPPSPEFVALLDRLAAECLEITDIPLEVFGHPAKRISLKVPK